MSKDKDLLLQDAIKHIRDQATASEDGHRCMVAPSPELRERIEASQAEAAPESGLMIPGQTNGNESNTPGFNDGLIYPGSVFPIGTPVERVRSAAANRAPLSGVLRVIVVLVEFSDLAMGQNQAHFEELFFSTNTLPNGSVREYFSEVTNNTVDIQGEVVGPYQLPLTAAQYANGASGIGTAQPNARTMARDAIVASNPDVDFGPYDNDGDGFVDAFVVVHAGPGGEQTGSVNDIWSHKWVIAGGAFNADGTNIFAYLTVPEDSKIGVCCHELGHLLFGFPDLYDTDGSSEGIGNWCLMAGGSWNGGGDVPAHPSAWCKVNQGWVAVDNISSNKIGAKIEDVKSANTVFKLWKDGQEGTEYFLVENRQQSGYDQLLPSEGLLIWHIDETISKNTNENHYKVALEQADGQRDLENNSNRGDVGDPFPGSSNNREFDSNSTPNSKSYAGVKTCVAVKNISASKKVMTADLLVKCGWDLNLEVKNFGYKAGGWRVNKHPRLLGDLTGDNRADILGFGNAGVYISLNNGDGTFGGVRRVVNNFGYTAGGWRTNKHPRFLADLTGNGASDIVGFGNAGVYRALNNGSAAFGAVTRVVNNFGYDAGGWRMDKHPRFTADITGDGTEDIIGFGNAGVYVSLNDGSGNFGGVSRVVNSFGYQAGGWRTERHPRFLADVTGDGTADIIGFGNAGVYISVNNGNGTFRRQRRVLNSFGYNAGGWRVNNHPRMMADITGDGTADIVGFGNAGVYVSINNGDGTFQPIRRVLRNFGYHAGGWRIDRHPRFLADMTGDGTADIIGFGNAGVYISFNNGNGAFQQPRRVIDNYGYNAGGWRVDRHPRALADLTGDGHSDIVGFGNAGVYVTIAE